jgi:RNA polymerase sigma-70 factor (ECF subfamily)
MCYDVTMPPDVGDATFGDTAFGDASSDAAFGRAVEPHRRELLVHCYRMLGSVHDAQDLVQETMTRAWRAFDRYDPERASVRTWLYRIATNACLTALQSRRRRPLPSDVGARFDDPDAPFVPGLDVPWLQPFPDALLGSGPADPADVAVDRSRLRLAVVAALQLLPARQRAVLLLREVLGLPASDVAGLLDTTTAAVNSALQRARATLAGAGVDPGSVAEPDDERQREVVDSYVAAFEAADVPRLTALLQAEVVLEMPPMWNWYRGRGDYGGFMARLFRMRGTRWRTIPLAANGQAGIAAYVGGADREAYALHTVQVFDVVEGRIARTTVFQDPDVFGLFDLAQSLGPR